MRRTKKNKTSTKERLVSFRLTEAENDLLNTWAEGARMSKSEYVRKLIAGRTPTQKVEFEYNPPEILDIFSNLETVTETLNRIAHDLNSGVKWNKEMHDEVVNSLKEIYRMRDELDHFKGEYRDFKNEFLTEIDNILSRRSCESSL